MVPLTAETDMVWACPVCGENWFREKEERIKAFEGLIKALSEFKKKTYRAAFASVLKTSAQEPHDLPKN